MTAKITSPIYDRNNDLTALLKIVTTADGFDFDAGSLGVVKVEYKVGEIWVYIPEGSRVITIKHPHFTLLRNYAYPIPIEGGVVYEMRLAHGELMTFVKEPELLSEFVVIDSEPQGADVYLNGVAVGTTPFHALKPEGQFEWRVEHELYKGQSGQFNLKAGNKEELTIKLKPNFGSVKVASSPESGARISLNGIDLNRQTPYLIERLPVGTHTISLRHEWYESQQVTVEVKAEEHQDVDVILNPTYALLDIKTDVDADILINGKKVGKGFWQDRLKPGVYALEVRKPSHTTEEKQVVLKPGDELTETLIPRPIYGVLKVLSEPLGADVYIGDEHRGRTPLILRNLLIGSHGVRIFKKNVGEALLHATVSENHVTEIEVNLNDRKYSVEQPAPKQKPNVTSNAAQAKSLSASKAKAQKVKKEKYRFQSDYDSGLLIGLNFYQSLPLTRSRKMNAAKEISQNWLDGNVGLGSGRGMGLTFNYIAFEEVYAIGFSFEMNYMRYSFRDTEKWENLVVDYNEYDNSGTFDSMDLGLGLSVNKMLGWDVFWNSVLTYNFVAYDFYHNSSFIFRDSQNEFIGAHSYSGWSRGWSGARLTLSSTVSFVAFQIGLRTSVMRMKDIETTYSWNPRNGESIVQPASSDNLRLHTLELVIGLVLGQPW